MIKILLAAWDVLVGNLILTLTSLITQCRLHIRGAQVGTKLRASGWVNLHLHRGGKVRIGTNCRFHSGFAYNPAGGYQRLGIWVSRGGQLTIGNNVGISNATIVCTNSVTIEHDVFIGGATNIYDTDFHSIASKERLTSPDTNVKTAPILIKRKCFIGAHVIILKGVTIGESAVIGAGSVVTHNVPDGEIWAGNPAKPIGHVT